MSGQVHRIADVVRETTMKHLVTGCWVVVADEDKALILENTGDTVHPVLVVKEKLGAASVQAHDKAAARGQGQRLHDKEGLSERNRKTGASLAQTVIRHLTAAHLAKSFHSLVLVAPPQVLGEMRDDMAGPLQAAVLFEMPKTLTAHSLPDIADHLMAHLAGV